MFIIVFFFLYIQTFLQEATYGELITTMSGGSRIQGQTLEVTVIGCSRLKDTEWISRQDPYVCLEYATSRFRTRTCTDGGRNPSFNERFVFSLVEGLPEMNIMVWNSNTFRSDNLIASGRIHLQEVLSQGHDDRSWPLQTSSGRSGGEIRLSLKFPNALLKVQASMIDSPKPGNIIIQNFQNNAPVPAPAPAPSPTLPCPPPSPYLCPPPSPFPYYFHQPPPSPYHDHGYGQPSPTAPPPPPPYRSSSGHAAGFYHYPSFNQRW